MRVRDLVAGGQVAAKDWGCFPVKSVVSGPVPLSGIADQADVFSIDLWGGD